MLAMPLIPILTGRDFHYNPQASQGANLAVRTGVAEIIGKVIAQGDAALVDYSLKFDQVELKALRASQSEIDQAYGEIDSKTKAIFQGSIDHIRAFHQKQLQQSWRQVEPDGTILGETVTPLDRVGVYIPGGKAFYPSTLIMNAVPALLAGVPEVVAVSPPGETGLPHPLVLGLCGMLGIKEVYTVGGAQAIAALAYGTETIRSVAKITGPGNQWVTEAKRQVFGKVGIDSVAGPSEILILHDDPSIEVEYLVRDLLSQAEHDEEATSMLVTTSKTTALAVQKRLGELVPTLPRAEIITASLKNHGKLIVVEQIEEGIEICNQIAPEHLEVLLSDASKFALIRNAGAVFVGPYSSEPVGDYYAGPNHTIPTSGAARYASPLSTRDFQKHSSYIQYSKARLLQEGEQIARFADLENLHAHAMAVRVRLEKEDG